MSKKCFGLRTPTWLAGVGLLVVLSTLAFAAVAVSREAGKSNASSTTAWYSENTPSSYRSPTAEHPQASSENPESAIRYAKSLSEAFHDAASKVLPSVVMITNTPAVVQESESLKPSPDENSEAIPFGFKGTPFGDLFKNPEFRRFFKELPTPLPRMPGHGMVGAGSGVIVDPSGIILTNNHVVEGGGQVMVRLQDGREFKAVDIKTDPKTDLAVLRIKGAGLLPAARLGDSNKVEVGDWVLALGEPFGLEGTVTGGIVSATGRGIGIMDREDFIQTDAAINPGNSGGPLVNLDGEVIGINTAISSRNGGYQGVGFAIPIDLAKWVGGQLERTGKVLRAYLGVGIQPVTQPLAKQFKVKVHEGVLVTEVQPHTPAAKAGLMPGDIILDFAGKGVSHPRQLQGLVEMAKIGSHQPLTILRDGKQMTLNVTCEEQPADFGLVRAGPQGLRNPEISHFEKLGLQVEDLTPQVAQQLRIKTEHGVVITDVSAGSPADLAGLRSGMVITEADHQPVKTVEDFHKILEKRPLDKGVLLLVRSAEGSRFVVIQVQSE
jgi:serine protease Do